MLVEGHLTKFIKFQMFSHLLAQKLEQPSFWEFIGQMHLHVCEMVNE